MKTTKTTKKTDSVSEVLLPSIIIHSTHKGNTRKEVFRLKSTRQTKELKKLLEQVFNKEYDDIKVVDNIIKGYLKDTPSIMRAFKLNTIDYCYAKIFPILVTFDTEDSKIVNRKVIKIELKD